MKFQELRNIKALWEGVLESPSNIRRLAPISLLLFFILQPSFVSLFPSVSSHLVCSDARACTTSLSYFSFCFEHLFRRMFPFLFQINIFCAMKVLLYSLIELELSASFTSCHQNVPFRFPLHLFNSTLDCSDLCFSVSSLRLDVQCDMIDSEINHVLPAFSVLRRECGLQREPLLFSCAGYSPKYRRLCPCRDFRRGQVALCRDCL